MLASPICNHYRQAILRGERIPGRSIDQFSEIRSPTRFQNMSADVFPDREELVIRMRGEGVRLTLVAAFCCCIQRGVGKDHPGGGEFDIRVAALQPASSQSPRSAHPPRSVS